MTIRVLPILAAAASACCSSLAAAQIVPPAASPAGSPAAASDTAAPDKSVYTLFNPVPTAQLRSFTPDRPNKGSSPITVDAGHFQYELDLLSYSYDHWNAGGTTSHSFVTADPVLKLGLTNHIDAEIALGGYQSFQQIDRATRQVTSGNGFGDVTLRVKLNLMGDDGGTVALAAIPWLKIPTASANLGNNLIEGGVAIPMTIALPADFSLGLQTEFDALRNGADNGRHVSFTNLASIGHPITDRLAAALEFFSQVGSDRFSPPIYTLDLAVTYLLTPATQLDLGTYAGLSKAAPDFVIYAGLAQRF